MILSERLVSMYKEFGESTRGIPHLPWLIAESKLSTLKMVISMVRQQEAEHARDVAVIAQARDDALAEVERVTLDRDCERNGRIAALELVRRAESFRDEAESNAERMKAAIADAERQRDNNAAWREWLRTQRRQD